MPNVPKSIKYGNEALGMLNYAIVPCGHLCICGDCMPDVKKSGSCPLCRDPFDFIMMASNKVFNGHLFFSFYGGFLNQFFGCHGPTICLSESLSDCYGSERCGDGFGHRRYSLQFAGLRSLHIAKHSCILATALFLFLSGLSFSSPTWRSTTQSLFSTAHVCLPSIHAWVSTTQSWLSTFSVSISRTQA